MRVQRRLKVADVQAVVRFAVDAEIFNLVHGDGLVL